MSINLRDKKYPIRDKYLNTQYKLIQEYPGSPKLNTIIKAEEHPEYMNSLLWVGGGLLLYGLRTENIIEWPKYWQKVK